MTKHILDSNFFNSLAKIIKNWIKKQVENKHISTIQYEIRCMIPFDSINTLNLYNRITQDHLCQIVKNKLHTRFYHKELMMAIKWLLYHYYKNEFT